MLSWPNFSFKFNPKIGQITLFCFFFFSIFSSSTHVKLHHHFQSKLLLFLLQPTLQLLLCKFDNHYWSLSPLASLIHTLCLWDCRPLSHLSPLAMCGKSPIRYWNLARSSVNNKPFITLFWRVSSYDKVHFPNFWPFKLIFGIHLA